MKLAFISLAIAFLCHERQMCETTDNQEDAIKQAISLFIKKSELYKHDSIFSVYQSNLGNNILLVSIYGSKQKIHLRTVGDSLLGKELIPNRYLLNNGKLFYWRSSAMPQQEGVISNLNKYGIIDTIDVKKSFPSSSVNDNKKASNYYMCLCNKLKYKIVESRISFNYIKIPKVKCNCP